MCPPPPPVSPGDTLIRRSISQQKTGVSITIDDPVRTARQPSPPRGKVSNIVHISNLVREHCKLYIIITLILNQCSTDRKTQSTIGVTDRNANLFLELLSLIAGMPINSDPALYTEETSMFYAGLRQMPHCPLGNALVTVR